MFLVKADIPLLGRSGKPYTLLLEFGSSRDNPRHDAELIIFMGDDRGKKLTFDFATIVSDEPKWFLQKFREALNTLESELERVTTPARAPGTPPAMEP